MAGGGGGGGGANPGDDSAFNIIWMISFIFLVAVVIWNFWGAELKEFFLWLKKYQLIVIKYGLKILPLDFLNLSYIRTEVANALNLVYKYNSDPASLSLDDIGTISATVGSYMRYPLTLLLMYFSYYGFFKNPLNRYSKTYNMNTLRAQESTEWPQINPVIGLDLVKENLNAGPWAMAKSPLDFCKDHKLINIYAEQDKEFKVGKPISYKMKLDLEQANVIFTQQLGKLWQSPDKLPLYQRAIFAIFLARSCRESKVAANLTRQINISSNSKRPGELNFATVDEIWRKYYSQRVIQETVKTHAYIATVFIDLLLLARQDGVLSTADFLWLKPLDRQFWYILNSTGRQTIFVEAAGPHAHFLVEKALDRGLSVPYIAEATKALQFALNEIIFVPSEEEKEQLLKDLKK